MDLCCDLRCPKGSVPNRNLLLGRRAKPDGVSRALAQIILCGIKTVADCSIEKVSVG